MCEMAHYYYWIELPCHGSVGLRPAREKRLIGRSWKKQPGRGTEKYQRGWQKSRDSIGRRRAGWKETGEDQKHKRSRSLENFSRIVAHFLYQVDLNGIVPFWIREARGSCQLEMFFFLQKHSFISAGEERHRQQLGTNLWKHHVLS